MPGDGLFKKALVKLARNLLELQRDVGPFQPPKLALNYSHRQIIDLSSAISRIFGYNNRQRRLPE